MKILVIDDERPIRNSLKEILGDEGYTVETAESGAQALRSKLWRLKRRGACFLHLPAVGFLGGRGNPRPARGRETF